MISVKLPVKVGKVGGANSVGLTVFYKQAEVERFNSCGPLAEGRLSFGTGARGRTFWKKFLPFNALLLHEADQSQSLSASLSNFAGLVSIRSNAVTGFFVPANAEFHNGQILQMFNFEVELPSGAFFTTDGRDGYPRMPSNNKRMYLHTIHTTRIPEQHLVIVTPKAVVVVLPEEQEVAAISLQPQVTLTNPELFAGDRLLIVGERNGGGSEQYAFNVSFNTATKEAHLNVPKPAAAVQQ